MRSVISALDVPALREPVIAGRREPDTDTGTAARLRIPPTLSWFISFCVASRQSS